MGVSFCKHEYSNDLLTAVTKFHLSKHSLIDTCGQLKTVLLGFPARTGPRADKKVGPWPAGFPQVTRGLAGRTGPRATLFP